MPPLLLPLPTTSNISFSNLLVDPSSSFTSDLADATATRTRLSSALRAVAENAADASAVAVIDAVQSYLPYLRGIIDCLDSDLLLFKGDPVFPWRAPLTHYTFAAPLLPLPSIQAEHLMVLLTYTLALSQYAHSILASLPSFEPTHGSVSSFHISPDDEKKTTAGLARAVDLLTQASGIAQWAAENVCPKLDGVKVASGRLGKYKWPVEVSQDAYRGLSMMLLADAHVTAIRKLLLPVLPHILFAPPGPPLASNHPSASLLAKLNLHAASLYDSSRALFGIHCAFETAPRKLFATKDKERDSTEDSTEGGVIPPLRRYLHKESSFASGIARKWLGVDVGENTKGAHIGEAIAWLRESQSRLSELADSAVREKMKGLSVGKTSDKRKDERKARKGRVERELEDIRAWLKAYQRMNDTVSFQSVPPASSLVWPSGRPIFAAKAFVPPPRKFTSTQDDTTQDDKVDSAYAGKGTYY